MTVWRCLVAGSDGLADWRIVEAPTADAALASVSADGSIALDIRSGTASLIDRLGEPVQLGRGMSVGDQSLLLSQLATLVQSGLPVDRSLDLLRDQAPRRRTRILLARMLTTVRSGGGLAAAFEESGAFPRYAVGVIRAAERGGGLGAALNTLGDRMTLAAETRRQLVTALTYPAAILAATLIALAIVLTLVVPQFEPIFHGEEARLPALTRAVLALSGAVTRTPLLTLTLLVGPPIALIVGLRTPAGRAIIDAHGSRLPLLALRDQYLAAQFVGILATLIGNGVKVVSALPLVRDAMTSPRWARFADTAERRVREGQSLSMALTEGKLLPVTAVRLIEVGERSGRLAETCAQASTIIGDAASARIERIVALVNPIAIMLLGGFVAALVGGVMLGIFALGDFAG